MYAFACVCVCVHCCWETPLRACCYALLRSSRSRGTHLLLGVCVRGASTCACVFATATATPILCFSILIELLAMMSSTERILEFVLQQDHILETLREVAKNTLLKLLFVSKSIFKIVVPFVSSQFLFRYDPAHPFTLLNPRKLHVNLESQPVTFPPYVELLKFGPNFNHKSGAQNLPPNLHTLIYGDWFNFPLDSLPPRLTHLSLGQRFNKPLDNLPPTLTHLTTGFKFNSPLDHLPPALTHLTLVGSFDQPLTNLPPSLRHLTISHSFSHPFDTIPRSVTRLHITGSHQHCNFDNQIGVVEFMIGHEFMHTVAARGTFPPNTTHLCVVGQCSSRTCTIYKWPQKIKVLECIPQVYHQNWERLPPPSSKHITRAQYIEVKF
eukprot:Phypoly_transcript_05530.p1 GENE.Phypoly_transcript_05530~~Phypoly_transcript_05530.p1  ORF type:complete len:381 (-),score=54.67 Phypoly_transcript_05530:77-1219(-)